MRSGFVAVVGRPNVGKSTLVNALVGSKVAITSSRPQTTRNSIRGVVHLEEAGAQLVLVDTPGLHRPRTALGERLNRIVYGTLTEVDAACFVIEADNPVGPGDRLIAERLSAAGIDVVVAVNKVDAASRDEIGTRLATAGEWDFGAYVPVSAEQRAGLDVLLQELVALLPEGPEFYPAGMVTDQPEELVIAEIVREKFIRRLHDELPHSLAVDVRDMIERDDGTVYIDARLVVERNSQKGIVIGRGGSLIREAGAEARTELEALLGTKVFLDLKATVERDWQRKDVLLDRLGF